MKLDNFEAIINVTTTPLLKLWYASTKTRFKYHDELPVHVILSLDINEIHQLQLILNETIHAAELAKRKGK